MSTFQERFSSAFDAEVHRRRDAGEPILTKTMVWKAAESTSGAFSQWYSGPTTATLDRCLKMAPLLRVNGRWLFDETGEKSPEAPSPAESATNPPQINEKLTHYVTGLDHLPSRVRSIIDRLIERQSDETLIGLIEHVIRALEPSAQTIADEQNRDGFHGNINASRINMARQQQKPTETGSE